MAAPSVEPRISSLEADVRNLSNDVRSLADSVGKLRDSIAEGGKPQWANLLSAVALSVVIIGAVGASFVTPLQITLAGHEKLLDERGGIIDGIQDRLRAAEATIIANAQVSSQRDEHLAATLADVKSNGSPITRERLAVLEYATAQMMTYLQQQSDLKSPLAVKGSQ